MGKEWAFGCLEQVGLLSVVTFQMKSSSSPYPSEWAAKFLINCHLTPIKLDRGTLTSSPLRLSKLIFDPVPVHSVFLRHIPHYAPLPEQVAPRYQIAAQHLLKASRAGLIRSKKKAHLDSRTPAAASLCQMALSWVTHSLSLGRDAQ
ncbi:uncharacterized protein UDID_18080 [Ustilago sp. UG-2017a]|nr:uncharacterized protein UDID_18080 [Ustilago sp. UG-2017a]